MAKMAPMLWMMLLAGMQVAGQTDRFPGVTASPIRSTPLSQTPSVLGLDHLEPAQMSSADDDVVRNLSAELSQQAGRQSFDISRPGWHYQQVVCPAFPDYVFLSFHHGADENGSAHFTAILPRSDANVRVIATYAHGALPFAASWNRPGTFEVFNSMLRRQRGLVPISHAPNWLTIAVCYAELSGYPVQVVNATPLPETSVDLMRLDANQPELKIAADESADITFSDVSRPGVTTHWSLHFDRHGQVTSAAHRLVRQPSAIALKP